MSAETDFVGWRCASEDGIICLAGDYACLYVESRLSSDPSTGFVYDWRVTLRGGADETSGTEATREAARAAALATGTLLLRDRATRGTAADLGVADHEREGGAFELLASCVDGVWVPVQGQADEWRKCGAKVRRVFVTTGGAR